MRQLIWKEPSRTLIFCPELVLMVLLVVWLSRLEPLFVMLPIALVYLATTTRILHHLGESFRYLEYGLFFWLPFEIARLCVDLPYNDRILVLACYFTLICFGVVVLMRLIPRTWDSDRLSEFLRHISLSAEDVVYPVSMRLGADICARTECRSFWWQPGGITDPEQYEKFIEDYPYLKKDWSDLIAEFNVTHVLCQRAALNAVSWQYDFSGLTKVHEDENYIAYKTGIA